MKTLNQYSTILSKSIWTTLDSGPELTILFFSFASKGMIYRLLIHKFYQIWTTTDFGGVLYLLYSIKRGLVLSLLEILLPGIVPWNSVPGGQGCQMFLPRGWLRVIIKNLLNRPVQKMYHDYGNASLFPEMFHLWYYNIDTCFKEISDNSEHSLVFWSVYQSVCLYLLFLFLKSGQFVYVVIRQCQLFSWPR